MQPQFMENIDANLDSLANDTALRLEVSIGGKVIIDVVCADAQPDKLFVLRMVNGPKQELALFGKTTVRDEVKNVVKEVIGNLLTGRFRKADVTLSRA